MIRMFSINDFNGNAPIKLFPNPTSEKITFVLREDIIKKIEIGGLKGSVMFSEDFKDASEGNSRFNLYEQILFYNSGMTKQKFLRKKIIKS